MTTRAHFHALSLLTVGTLLASACFAPPDVVDTDETSGGDASDTSMSVSADDDGTPDGGDDSPGGDAPDDGPPQDGDGSSSTTSAEADDDGSAADDDTTTSSMDGGATCDATSDCVPEPPVGWSGPVAVYRGAEAPPACPAAFPEVAVAAGTEIAAPPAECGCECGEASGFECTVTVTEAGEECGFLVFNPDQWSIDAGECQLVDTVANAFTANNPVLDPSGGSCAPSANESVAEAGWGVNVQACLASSADACDGGTCVGALDDAYDRICVYTGGDVECPAGGYTDREVVYSSFTDTRDCSSCTCGAPSGSCNGTVYYASGCVGLATLYGSDVVPGCGEASGEPNALRYTAAPNVDCDPSGGNPIGGVTPTGAITVCCLP